MEKLSDIIFYSIDKSIKTYRQFAQKNISKAGIEITIDQWLVLKTIEEDNSIAQKDIAIKTFKDVASITRIIELLVQKGYLSRKLKSEDRRRSDLALTAEGDEIIKKMQPYIQINRAQALKDITDEEIKNLHSTLSKIISNIN